MYLDIHAKCAVLSADFNLSLNFLDGISKKSEILNFTKILFQWQASCSTRKDEQTDMTSLIVAFHNFAKALKMHYIIFSEVS